MAVSYYNNSIEIWDVRSLMAPLRKLQNPHTTHSLSLAWNSSDANVLIASGYDSGGMLSGW